jgi:AcrR family transcriptional regulator
VATSGRRTAQPVRRSDQRRHDELIQITSEVFAEKGFEGASLQDIADGFGILKGSLFHYIQSKDDLLYEIIKGVYVGAEDSIWAIAKDDDTATNRLHRLIIAYVTYIADHQPSVTVWLHDLNSLEASRRKEIAAFEERDRNRLSDLIAEAQREGSIPEDSDLQILTFALLGAMNWVHRWYRPGRLSPAEIGDALFRIHLRGGPSSANEVALAQHGKA